MVSKLTPSPLWRGPWRYDRPRLMWTREYRPHGTFVMPIPPHPMAYRYHHLLGPVWRRVVIDA